jgi:ADP-heptose:LPS heptosyltransferase
VLGRRYELAVSPVFDGASEWGTLLFGMVSASRKLALEDPALRDAHEMDKTLAVLRAAGCKVATRQDIWPDVGLREEERRWAEEALGKAESRKQKAEKNSIDCRLQTADGGGKAGIQTEDGRLKTEDNVNQTADYRPQTVDLAPHPPYRRRSLPKSLQSAVCSLQSSPFTLAICPGARFKQKQWGSEKFAELIVELGYRVAGLQGCRVEGGQGCRVAGDGDMETADRRLQTADFLGGEATGSDDAEQGLQSTVYSLQSSVCLRVLILGGPEDREVAREIIEKVESRKQKAEIETEDLGGKVESRKQKAEINTIDCRLQTTDCRRKTEDGCRTTGCRLQTADCRRKTEDGRRRSEDRERRTDDRGAKEGSLAEAQRTQRNINEEPRTKNEEPSNAGNEEPSTFNLQPSTLLIDDWTGRCSLHQSFALIEQSDLCVGNDTLGLHVAIAVGTPSVVIMWGGDGEQWIPWGDPEKHRMVRADMDCRGCQGACVHERFKCMEKISVEMVMEAIGKAEIWKAEI